LRVLALEHDSEDVEAPRLSGRAALVISGSVRAAADRARVTTQLLDGVSGYYLWSESTDAALADPIAAQEAIAKMIAEKLQHELADGGNAAGSLVGGYVLLY
jgi:TolB-like protein